MTGPKCKFNHQTWHRVQLPTPFSSIALVHGLNARADDAADAYKLAQSRIQAAGFQCSAVYSAMLTNRMVTVNGFLDQKYTDIDKAGWGSVSCDS
jgi:hypothetical protein